MSAAQVRDAMAASPGAWTNTRDRRTEILTWRGSGAREIRFELHEGLLTAVRAVLEPGDGAARGPALEVTPLIVAARRRRSDGLVEYTALARDCSQLADEVAALVREPSQR